MYEEQFHRPYSPRYSLMLFWTSILIVLFINRVSFENSTARMLVGIPTFFSGWARCTSVQTYFFFGHSMAPVRCNLACPSLLNVFSWRNPEIWIPSRKSFTTATNVFTISVSKTLLRDTTQTAQGKCVLLLLYAVVRNEKLLRGLLIHKAFEHPSGKRECQ